MKDQEPLCRICKANGFIVSGEELDHIVPLSKGGKLMDEKNVQHLCKPCHEEKSRGENRASVRVDVDGTVHFLKPRLL